MTEGYVEVNCQDCGQSLGYQYPPIIWELWRHVRCPQHIAELLSMSRQDYNKLFSEVTASILAAYPEFPNNVINEPGMLKMKVLRAEIAAGMVLENLGNFHYKILDPD